MINYESMYPLGDSAIVVQFGSGIDLETHRLVQQLARTLDSHPLPAVMEYVPGFTSVTVFYDCLKAASYGENLAAGVPQRGTPYQIMAGLLHQLLKEIQLSGDYEPAVVEIPVCYGGEFGPDLEFVAEHNGLTPEEVIGIHSQGEYLTYMVGFAPGFPYLGGLSERIAAPRRETPRLKIPIGTVGIAGMQTGVYPIETPGGWQLIGRTPLSLFRPGQWPPTLIQAGNVVRFKPISREEYDQLSRQATEVRL